MGYTCVEYSFSPLFSKEKMKVAFDHAREFGHFFPGLTIICRDHWISSNDTIVIKGIVDDEDYDFFKDKLKNFKKFLEEKT